MLIGCTGIVVSTVHATVKFQTANGVGTIFSSYNEGKHQESQKMNESQNHAMDTREGPDSKEHVVLDESHPVRRVEIGKQLPTAFKERLEKLLKAYEDVFVGKYSEMIGVPRFLTINGKPSSTEHKLNESKYTKPVKQKPHRMTSERSMEIHKEVYKLAEAGILRKVESPLWVTNPIAIQRRDGEWKIHVNFEDINKACKK